MALNRLLYSQKSHLRCLTEFQIRLCIYKRSKCFIVKRDPWNNNNNKNDNENSNENNDNNNNFKFHIAFNCNINNDDNNNNNNNNNKKCFWICNCIRVKCKSTFTNDNILKSLLIQVNP